MPVTLPPPIGRLVMPNNVIGPWSREALGGALANSGDPTAWATTVYPTISLAIAYPIVLTQPKTTVSMWCYNGTAVSGNIDMGIYTAAGVKVATGGTTAHAGTTTLQKIAGNLASVALSAGVVYYLALACDNTTAQFRAYTTAASVNFGVLAGLGVVQMATAFVLPTTLTIAALATNYLPLFGVSFVSTY